MQRIGLCVLTQPSKRVLLGSLLVARWTRHLESKFLSTQAKESQAMEVVPGKTSIGWIGTGVMGKSFRYPSLLS